MPTGPSWDGHFSQKPGDFSCWHCALPFLPPASVFIPLAGSLLSCGSPTPASFPQLDCGHLEASSGSASDSSVHPWHPWPSGGYGGGMN